MYVHSKSNSVHRQCCEHNHVQLPRAERCSMERGSIMWYSQCSQATVEWRAKNHTEFGFLLFVTSHCFCAEKSGMHILLTVCIRLRTIKIEAAALSQVGKNNTLHRFFRLSTVASECFMLLTIEPSSLAISVGFLQIELIALALLASSAPFLFL